MNIHNTCIRAQQPVGQKSIMEAVEEVCKKNDPPPIFCELPDGLRIKSIEASGTSLTYTYTSSMISTASSIGTSTTTTI